MIQRNTIYTNVALRPDGTPWWEGHDDPPPREALDWQGRPWTPASTEKAAHPNSRFTTPAAQCASLSPEFDNPDGVPIDAMLFGARRQRRVPLVYRGARLAARHVPRRDALVRDDGGRHRQGRRPAPRSDGDAGRSAATTWATTSSTGSTSGRSLTTPPKIFRVNWFRTERGRGVPLARLRRQPPRAEVDPRSLRRPRQAPSRPRSAPCRRPTPSIARASTCPTR